MKYQFPEINTIDDILPHIKGRDEFKVIDKGDYTIIDYVYVEPDSFDNIYRRECRGITFDKDGYLISRPFHKFFNLGEREETQPHIIDFSKPHIVLSKLDGSMIRPVLVNDTIYLMTRKGNTDVANQALDECGNKWFSEFEYWIKGGYTPIYEFISPLNKIVIDYEKPDLVFLGVRHNKSGMYVPQYSQSIETNLSFKSGNDLQEHVKNVTEKIEGYVVRFDDGHMIKIKTEEYLRLHKVIDVFNSEKNIVNLILNDEVDDLYPSLTIEKQKVLRSFVTQINHRIKLVSSLIRGDVDEHENDTQKEFANWVMEWVDNKYRPLYFQFRLKPSKDDFNTMRTYMLKHTGSSTKIEHIRGLIGKPWETHIKELI